MSHLCAQQRAEMLQNDAGDARRRRLSLSNIIFQMFKKINCLTNSGYDDSSSLEASRVSPQHLGGVFDIDVVRERSQTQNECWRNSNLQKNMPNSVNLSVRPELAN